MNEDNDLSFGGVFRNNNNYEDQASGGIEYNFMKSFYLRGGYVYQWDNTDLATYDWSVGAGISFDIISSVNIVFDYAYRNVQNLPADNHVFTLLLGVQ